MATLMQRNKKNISDLFQKFLLCAQKPFFDPKIIKKFNMNFASKMFHFYVLM
jgi:hypothetical protein